MIFFKISDYCCSALFDKDIGIIAFLQKVAAKDEVIFYKNGLIKTVVVIYRLLACEDGTCIYYFFSKSEIRILITF